VFGSTEGLSRDLQAKHITAQEAFQAAECTRQFNNRLRNENAFHTLFELAKVVLLLILKIVLENLPQQENAKYPKILMDMPNIF
jgi:hypothetical protein